MSTKGGVGSTQGEEPHGPRPSMLYGSGNPWMGPVGGEPRERENLERQEQGSQETVVNDSN